MNRLLTLEDIELLEQLAIFESRESFWAYRQFLHPKLKKGWFVKDLSNKLQQFYEDYKAGKRPKLAIDTPPQHGKSAAVVDFITWVAGKDPDAKTIFASFSERLGIRANLSCQRIYDSKKYKKIFPETRISGDGVPDAAGSTRNREMLEYVGRDGYFRNTTVRGQITGESCDIGIIDDAFKGRAEVSSETVRNAVHQWYADDFSTRLSDFGAVLIVNTRWHVADLVGYLKDTLGSELQVVSYKAIAEEDEKHRKAGEALFPQHKSIEFLLGIKRTMANSSWNSLYQGNPQVEGGELIRGSYFGRYSVLPLIKERRIYADTAQKTAERNDYTVFECWGKGEDGKLYLIDLFRDKLESPDLRRRAKDFWEKHKSQTLYPTPKFGALRIFRVEDKSSGTGLIQELKADTTTPIPVTGIERGKDKYTRVLDILGYIESGHIMIPDSAPWVLDFINECESFTADDSHLHDDQVDPMVDAIKEMIAVSTTLSVWERLGK